MAQPPFSIAGIAKAYCEDQWDAAMYREALVLAQCDVLILQLRANGTVLLNSIGARQAVPAAMEPEAYPYRDESLALNKAGFSQPADAAPTRLRPPRGGASPSWDPLQSAFHHLKALSRMEDELYRRRRRALRNLVAIRKAILTDTAKRSVVGGIDVVRSGQGAQMEERMSPPKLGLKPASSPSSN